LKEEPIADSAFDHLPSQEELLASYRQTKKADPTSTEYERILVRPSLHIVRTCLFLLAGIAIAFLLAMLAYLLWERVLYAVLVGVSVIILLSLLFMKHILIWMIMAYQRFAPDKLRNRCRYEPSCSQYMILSIKKYGVINGLIKGFRRWHSCKPPNGGFDPP